MLVSGQSEAALADFAQRLRNFRPSATVLEAEIAHVKSTFTNPLLDADNLRSKSNDVSDSNIPTLEFLPNAQHLIIAPVFFISSYRVHEKMLILI